MKRRAAPGGKKAQPRRVTFAGARRLALALPGVVEGTCYGTPAFRIAGRFFFRLREDGESLALKIDFDTREALLQASPRPSSSPITTGVTRRCACTSRPFDCRS